MREIKASPPRATQDGVVEYGYTVMSDENDFLEYEDGVESEQEAIAAAVASVLEYHDKAGVVAYVHKTERIAKVVP